MCHYLPYPYSSVCTKRSNPIYFGLMWFYHLTSGVMIAFQKATCLLNGSYLGLIFLHEHSLKQTILVQGNIRLGGLALLKISFRKVYLHILKINPIAPQERC